MSIINFEISFQSIINCECLNYVNPNTVDQLQIISTYR